MEIQVSEIVGNDYLEKQLDKLKNKIIFLYGAGSFGKETCCFLEDHGIGIFGFLDRRAAEIKAYCGKPVYGLDDALQPGIKEKALVLFSIVMDKDKRKLAIADIRKAGFGQIEEAQFYRSIQIVPDDLGEENLKDYYIARKSRIEEAYEALGDEKSKHIYKANIKAHFLREFSECVLWEDPMEEQYFPNDIKLAAGYGRFIDCGGYVGDTVEALLRREEKVQSIVSFEPDFRNFGALTDFSRGCGKEIFCFPCAVSDKTCLQRFSAAGGSGTLSEEGECTILSVSLDEALNGFRPTFIKMDIEGAEIKAIHGAKNMICGNVPDLAICVYHHINHLWDILLLLKSWNPGYEFFLRNYNAYTMETVLYATGKDRHMERRGHEHG